MTNTYYLLFLLLASIGFIIWITAYRKVNAFFALLLAALGVGLLSGLPLGTLVGTLKLGFGHTMEKIGLLIILGTTLGVILEKTGATMSMANRILRLVNEKNAPAAIALTGFIIGFPIFCDSGFIILSGLNHSLVRKTHHRMPVMAAALATSPLRRSLPGTSASGYYSGCWHRGGRSGSGNALGTGALHSSRAGGLRLERVAGT